MTAQEYMDKVQEAKDEQEGKDRQKEEKAAKREGKIHLKGEKAAEQLQKRLDRERKAKGTRELLD